MIMSCHSKFVHFTELNLSLCKQVKAGEQLAGNLWIKMSCSWQGISLHSFTFVFCSENIEVSKIHMYTIEISKKNCHTTYVPPSSCDLVLTRAASLRQ